MSNKLHNTYTSDSCQNNLLSKTEIWLRCLHYIDPSDSAIQKTCETTYISVLSA